VALIAVYSAQLELKCRIYEDLRARRREGMRRDGGAAPAERDDERAGERQLTEITKHGDALIKEDKVSSSEDLSLGTAQR
jgi:hypothetical protein